MHNESQVTIIGGGLAGTEAAWQAAERGIKVRLYEMRPARPTPAHQSDNLAEIVCSNSLKSDEPGTAPYLLKEELRRGGSLLISVAHQTAVPAGAALAVDRERFAEEVTRRIAAHPNDRTHSRRDSNASLRGTGCDCDRTAHLARALRTDHAIDRFEQSVISTTRSRRSSMPSRSTRASRFAPLATTRAATITLNCPFNEEEYDRFYDALTAAESVALHEFEKTMYFEACLPIEELARRGRDTLRYGPMKPVGLRDPRNGRQPWAVVQLRQENLLADSYNLVGFQNHLKFGEQKRVLRLIPGLEQAEFIRFGQIHRNTFICAPAVLRETLQMRSDPRVLFAGQISGVEGYIEAMATGFMAGVHAAELARGRTPASAAAPHCDGRLDELHRERGHEEFSADEHHVCVTAAA